MSVQLVPGAGRPPQGLAPIDVFLAGLVDIGQPPIPGPEEKSRHAADT